MFGIGMTEMLIVGVIVLVVFGARRLPEIGSGIGKGIKSFKAGVLGKEEGSEIEEKPSEVGGERSQS